MYSKHLLAIQNGRKIQSQLINGQTAFDRPDVTVPVFKSRLDKFKTNIRNGKYFKLCKVIYIIHMIEYQYHGMPHVYMVFHLDNTHDIDADNQEDLIDFVARNFMELLPGKNFKMFIGGILKMN